MKSCSKAYPGRPYTQHMQGQIADKERLKPGFYDAGKSDARAYASLPQAA